MTWSFTASMQAMNEGWDVFDADGTPAIQRLDDPYSVPELGYDEPKFEDDSDAFHHVLARAREGSRLHIEALAAVRGVQCEDIVKWLADGGRGCGV